MKTKIEKCILCEKTTRNKIPTGSCEHIYSDGWKYLAIGSRSGTVGRFVCPKHDQKEIDNEITQISMTYSY